MGHRYMVQCGSIESLHLLGTYSELRSCRPRQTTTQPRAQPFAVPSSKPTACERNAQLERRHSSLEEMVLSRPSQTTSSRLSSEGDSRSVQQHSSDAKTAASPSRSHCVAATEMAPRIPAVITATEPAQSGTANGAVCGACPTFALAPSGPCKVFLTAVRTHTGATN